MEVVKLVFDIDRDLRNRFKSRLALDGRTVKEFLTKAIEDYLKEPSKRKGKP